MQQFEAVLLVCAQTCDSVEKLLLEKGYRVTRVNDGEAAVSIALKCKFELAFLVSTGEKMDLTETALNLRDIRESMQIIIVENQPGREEKEMTEEIVAHTGSNTKVLSMEELGSFIYSQRALSAE